MSNEFLNGPEYDVEGLKDAVDHFFLNNPEAVVKKPEDPRPKAPSTKAKKTPKAKLKLPDPPVLSDEDQTHSTEVALDELECIREEFYEYQVRISHLAIYPYIYQDIENFVNSCIEMKDMIEDNIDVKKLSSEGKKDYDELQKVRQRILSTIFNYYKDKE